MWRNLAEWCIPSCQLAHSDAQQAEQNALTRIGACNCLVGCSVVEQESNPSLQSGASLHRHRHTIMCPMLHPHLRPCVCHSCHGLKARHCSWWLLSQRVLALDCINI